MYTSLSAAAILSTVIGAWIGYSFVSMTQERFPRVFDAVHVFFLAFCFYLVNSTLGMEIWWFFSALCLYHGVGLFAVIYNANILVKSLSTSYDWRIFKGCMLLMATCIGVYVVGAWMSIKGMLPSGIEILLIVHLIISNILWVYLFHLGWNKLIKEEA